MDQSSLRLGARDLAALGLCAAKAAAGAEELSRLQEEDEEAATLAGVEALVVEARALLRGGAASRVTAAAARGGPVRTEDMADVSRLEGVVSSGVARISRTMAALEVAEDRSVADKIGSAMGLASGAVGLVRSFL